MGADQSKLSEADVKFLEANTQFTREQIGEEFLKYRGQFPDEKISEQALKQFYIMVFPDAHPDDFASLMFKFFDKDKSGDIEFKEFLLGLNVLKNKDNPLKLLHWAFSICNTLGDDKIRLSELEKVIWASESLLGKTPDQLAKRVFKRMDKNLDSVITFEEFKMGCMADPFLLQLLTGGVADVLAAYEKKTSPFA